ncbi:MAG: HepT-like ribonuclease domain-containing protein [Bacteroidota bacterium]
MTRIDKKYLYDISSAIHTILNHFLNGVDTYEAFEADAKTRAAVERMLMIIGEALLKLQRSGIHFSVGDQMINRRNTIVHQYDAYNPETIWLSIHQELPLLKKEVDQQMKS